MRIVLTGPPGSGKTSVIEELEANLPPDWAVFVPEVARGMLAFLREYEPHKMSMTYIQDLIETLQLKGWADNSYYAFFDRGIPDQMAYRTLYGLRIPEVLVQNAQKYRYDKVFFFPFWEEIYKQDDVRRESTKDAKHIDRLIQSAYRTAGYELEVVPRASIEDRANFIMSHIESLQKT
jgi:predicted ATPase